MTIITRVCGKCGKFLGIKDGHGVSGVSHGLCPTCQAEMERETQEWLKEHRRKVERRIKNG